MVQVQWLQLKMKFLLGYNIKFVIYWGWGGGNEPWGGNKSGSKSFFRGWGDREGLREFSVGNISSSVEISKSQHH